MTHLLWFNGDLPHKNDNFPVRKLLPGGLSTATEATKATKAAGSWGLKMGPYFW